MACLSNFRAALDRFWKLVKQSSHLRRRFEMTLCVDREPEAGFGNGAFLANTGEHVGQRSALRSVIMHLVDSDERSADALAEFVEKAETARLVAAIAMRTRDEAASQRRAGKH